LESQIFVKDSLVDALQGQAAQLSQQLRTKNDELLQVRFKSSEPYSTLTFIRRRRYWRRNDLRNT